MTREKKPIGWGIIGTGYIARLFAQALLDIPDAQMIAVASRTLASAREFSKKYRVKFAYEGYQDLIENPEVDIVYIATPNSKHKEHSILCLNANKPVLCEKPFALNAHEAKAVIDLAQSKNIFCMEAMWTRFLPLVRQMRGLIQNGAIGDLHLLTADFSMPAAFNPKKDVFNPEMGGGALLDRGIYGISLAVHLFGKPSKVTGKLVMGPSGVDDMTVVSLGFPDGKMAMISCSLNSWFTNEAVITGSTGRIRICEPFFRPYMARMMRFPVLPGVEGLHWLKKLYVQLLENYIVRFYRGNGYNYEAREVMECLRQGKLQSDIMPLEDSLVVMEIMDSVRKQNNFRFPGELKGGQ